MNALTFSMALLMGLTGSLHCAGMCGPIIWVMPFQSLSGFRKGLGIGLYHFGRISVYALLGVLLYSFRSLFHPQWQQYVSMALGVVLLVLGLLYFLPGKGRGVQLPWRSFIAGRLGKVLQQPGLGSLFLAGVLNGLLPCGMVYMALATVTAAAGPLQAMGTMYAFGLGTIPMLVSLTLLKSRFSALRLNSARKLVPALLLVFGSLFLVRGMNLGIPYLSPEVKVEQGVVKHSCCHK